MATKEVLSSWYEIYGGSARLVLDTTKRRDPTKWLIEVTMGVSSYDAIYNDIAEGSGTQHKDGSSRILHLYCGHDASGKLTYKYQERRTVFASRRVEEELMGRFLGEAKKKVLRRLAAAYAWGDQYYVSLVFEPVVHAYLRQDLPFADANGDEVRPLPSGLKFRTFDGNGDSAIDQAPAGTYNRPNSASFPSIDSFAKLPDSRVILFQATGQERHPINMPGMLSLFRCAPGKPGAVRNGDHYVFVPPDTVLFFVVTPPRAGKFDARQRYVSRSGGKALACTRNPQKYIAENIAQRVIVPVLSVWPS